MLRVFDAGTRIPLGSTVPTRTCGEARGPGECVRLQRHQSVGELNAHGLLLLQSPLLAHAEPVLT